MKRFIKALFGVKDSAECQVVKETIRRAPYSYIKAQKEADLWNFGYSYQNEQNPYKKTC